MVDYESLKARVQELAEREWDMEAIVARYRKMAEEGIPRKALSPEEALASKEQILERVQQRAEEYNFLARNCAKGTALALLEEFGLGNLEIIQALSPFPGFGGTGWMCGAVTGGLIALGLYFGSQDVLNYAATRAAIQAAREFMPRFQVTVGSVLCPEIQEKVIFGRYMDPAASQENMAAFAAAKGFEKCSLLPGIGARIAAEVIIESMRRNHLLR
ncbi:MAG: C-GCAxxG-C-C family protein [Anaerolineae bacterium]|nr:C-GCAxxG-C-C family protein [Anaerolineae bacterium]MDW8068719.1 C-GCAxxG-C-C family protein [Anaerolineae bacterium]